MRTSSYSIQGDLPFGPFPGLFSSTKTKSMPAMRSQVASLSGKGAAVSKGMPQPVAKAKSRIGVVGRADMEDLQGKGAT